MIKIICVGKLKEKYLKDAVDEYKKRLSKYTKLDIIEVADCGCEDHDKILKVESSSILKHLNPKDNIIVLDIKGVQLTSPQLSEKLEKWEVENSQLVFLIGGSEGLGKEIKERANFSLSFSSLTFPHQLFRVLLLEQLYRAYKIRHHEKYHK